MSYHESLGNNEADEDQLGNLYLDAVNWLDKNVPVTVDSDEEILGLHEGLPIAKDGPRMDFICFGDQVNEVVRHASEHFNDNDVLTFTYFLPFYLPGDDGGEEYEYVPPSLVVTFEREPDYTVILDIEKSDDLCPSYGVDRYIHMSEEIEDGLFLLNGCLPFVPEGYEKEDGGGESTLVLDEYNLIHSIVAGLDMIKELKQPEAPLYVDFSA